MVFDIVAPSFGFDAEALANFLSDPEGWTRTQAVENRPGDAPYADAGRRGRRRRGRRGGRAGRRRRSRALTQVPEAPAEHGFLSGSERTGAAAPQGTPEVSREGEYQAADRLRD